MLSEGKPKGWVRKSKKYNCVKASLAAQPHHRPDVGVAAYARSNGSRYELTSRGSGTF